MKGSKSPSGEYCIYLRKSRADAEAEQKGEGETLARHEAALLALAVICLWTGRSVTDVFNEDWLTTQTAAESPDALTDSDFAELEL